MDSDPWAAMDEWCQRQCEKLGLPMTEHIMDGGSLNLPNYRQQLGQHQAFMRMRSFIHGARERPR